MSSVVDLVERAGQAGHVRELFAAASARLRRLLPFDAAAWMAVDQATMLPTAPTRAENLGGFGGKDSCIRLWELEFLVEDVNHYHDLARADRPAASLQVATGGLPGRSALRSADAPAFDERETEIAASLSEPLGQAVRDHAAAPAVHAAARGPGLIIFDPAGELVSTNDDALAWLGELAGDIGGDDRFGIRLPMIAVSTMIRARAVAAARDRRSARARLRVGNRWLVCHASCLQDADGELGNTALVIEPAPPAEIAPLIAQAYKLTARERQITQLIAQGLPTRAIAARLHLSAHTVRDYVKAIFDKAGVSSRGELVATLFADHYAPLHLDPAGVDAIQT